MTTTAELRRPELRAVLNKVPEVTLYFWLIKVLCTTVGETAADYLNDTLGLGLTLTSALMGGSWSLRWSSSSGPGATSRASTGSPSCSSRSSVRSSRTT